MRLLLPLLIACNPDPGEPDEQVGYRTQHDTQDFSSGLGVGSNRLRGQYAYVPFGENLGDQHRFSVQIGL